MDFVPGIRRERMPHMTHSMQSSGSGADCCVELRTVAVSFVIVKSDSYTALELAGCLVFARGRIACGDYLQRSRDKRPRTVRNWKPTRDLGVGIPSRQEGIELSGEPLDASSGENSATVQVMVPAEGDIDEAASYSHS
jgi:hypothetical protein